MSATCARCGRDLPLPAAACFACLTRAPESALPERIAGYPVLREVGAGGMGTVYAALQDCPAREVAIKVIKDGVFADDELRERFLRERDIAGSFEHPNIIRVYAAGEDADGQLYYVMELAELGTLRELLRRESLPVPAAVRLMVEVAFAVDYAHGRGVLHRDLKPDNILIGADRRARVTDFGVARRVDAADSGRGDAVSAGTLVGSYAYMAPEQAGYGPAAGESGPAADIYGLGAILYELLSGAPPYAANSREELWRAFASGPPRALFGWARGADYDLEAVVLKALALDPGRRYASAAAFADDLRRTLGHRAPNARSARLRGRLVSALSHHAAWLGILLAALAISAGVVMSAHQTLVNAALREQSQLRSLTQRTASGLERVFRHVAAVSRQLALDTRSAELLAHARGPDASERPWMQAMARDNDLVSTLFLLTMDGSPAAHHPREADRYYQLRFQQRVYFGGARLSSRQGLGLDVFVSPLFRSRAAGSAIKVAFSSAVFGPDQTQLGVAVATIGLDKLLREVDPALVFIAPRELERSDGASFNVEQVHVTRSAQGHGLTPLASSPARQLYLANVARTDYAVAASLSDPPLSGLREALSVGVLALLALCLAALVLLRRAQRSSG